MTNPFTIDAASMQTIVAKAIMEGISQEQRDVVLQQAISQLIEPRKLDYGRTAPSPLQSAFNEAVTSSCYAVVRDVVASRPEFLDRIRVHVTEAVDKLIENNSELSSAVGDSIGSAVTKWASEQRNGRY